MLIWLFQNIIYGVDDVNIIGNILEKESLLCTMLTGKVGM